MLSPNVTSKYLFSTYIFMIPIKNKKRNSEQRNKPKILQIDTNYETLQSKIFRTIGGKDTLILLFIRQKKNLNKYKTRTIIVHIYKRRNNISI